MSSKIANRTLNIFTGAVVLYIAFMVGQRLLSTRNATSSLQGPKAGAAVALANVKWSEQKSTLIMALSTACHFCKESTEFYKELLSMAPPAVHSIAVFPEPVADAKKYLQSAAIKVTDVRQMDLGKLGVGGTPTLILVDQTGHVLRSWVGKLSSAEEKSVFQALGTTRAEVNRAPEDQRSDVLRQMPNLISPQELQSLRSQSSFSVLDVRERSEYQRGHIANWLNIPIDEMEARITHEVPVDKPVVVYCHYCPPCESEKARKGSMTVCTMAAFVLHGMGYSDIRFIADDLESLKTHGFAIVGEAQEETPATSTRS